MRPCEWIIYYNEAKGRFACIPVGSKAASFIPGKVAKGFYGTESEAIAETIRVERKAGITGLFSNAMSYGK